MHATILDYQSLCPDDLALDALFDCQIGGQRINWTCYARTQPDQTAARVSKQDIILTNKVVIDADLLAANTQLKLIIILATGTNNVDLTAARAMGIAVANIIAYSTESVVQQTFAMLLSLKSQLPAYTAAVSQG